MSSPLDVLSSLFLQSKDIERRSQLFKTSRFLQEFRKDGVVALVHQLHPEPLYLSERVWRDLPERVIANMAPEGTDELLQEMFDRRLLVRDENDDFVDFQNARSWAVKTLSRPTILYLMLSQGCSFNCTYCCIPDLAKKYGNNLLSFEDAAAGIRLWEERIKEQCHDELPYFLILYGGEPLLNRDLLEKLLPHIAKERQEGRLPRLQLMLCTNGEFVDPSIARLLRQYEVMVAVGIDGPAEINNMTRVTSAGLPSFSLIAQAIEILLKEKVQVVASVTMTPGNVHLLAEYYSFFKKLGISQFGFNLMKGKALLAELTEHNMSQAEYCQKAADGILLGFADITDGSQQYEYQFEKRLAVFQQAVPFSVDCTCYGNQIVVQADGQVTNCPFVRVDQGDIQGLPLNFRIDQTLTVQNWRKRLGLFATEFSDWNSGNALSGGGCAWSSSELSGDVLQPDRINEAFTREVVNGFIWASISPERAEALRRGSSLYWSDRRVRAR